MSASRPEKLVTLEVGRAIAAIAVVVHHAALAADAFAPGEYGAWFSWGIHGVDFFFVLSGFIILHTHMADTRNLQNARRFAVKRLRRIYAPYIPITLGLISLYLLLPGRSMGERDWGWLTSLTLLPTVKPPALSVAWTLVYEMVFYTFFLAFFFVRGFAVIVAGWAVLVALLWVMGGPPDRESNPFLHVALNPLILEFVAGMVSAYLFAKVPTRYGFVFAGLGLLAAIVFFLVGDIHRAFFGMAIAPLVLGVAMLEQARRFVVPYWAVYLGSASYAVYLVHNPLQSALGRFGSVSGSWTVTFAICVIVGTAGGIAYHAVVERPLLRALSPARGSTRQRLVETQLDGPKERHNA